MARMITVMICIICDMLLELDVVVVTSQQTQHCVEVPAF